MKANKSFMQMLPVGAFAFLVLFLASCAKQEYESVSPNQPNQQLIMKKLKESKFTLNAKNGKTFIVSGNGGIQAAGNFASSDAGGANFAGDNGGSSFSSNDAGSNFSSDQGSSNYANAGSGSNFNTGGALVAGGGNFTLNGESVQLDYVFCSDDDMFGFGFEEGYKVLVGIDGEFEDIKNVKIDYLVLMVLVGDEPSGNYKMDWEEIIAQQGDDPSGKFALVEIVDLSDVKTQSDGMDLEDGKIYLSSKGTMSAKNGTYSYKDASFVEIIDDEPGTKTVKGSGDLQCQ